MEKPPAATKLLPYMPSGLPTAYFETVFRLPDQSGQTTSTFAIVTAYNPMDEPCSVQINHAADEALKALLDDEKLEAFRAIGGSLDMSHAEPGWAIATSLPVALEIARRFHQRALWWIENGELHLVNCSDPTPILLGCFSDRIMDS